MTVEQPRNRDEITTKKDTEPMDGLQDTEPMDGLPKIDKYMRLISVPLREIKHIVNERMLGLLQRLGIMCQNIPELEGIRGEFQKMYIDMSYHLNESEGIYGKMCESMSKLLEENNQNNQNDQNDQ